MKTTRIIILLLFIILQCSCISNFTESWNKKAEIEKELYILTQEVATLTLSENKLKQKIEKNIDSINQFHQIADSIRTNKSAFLQNKTFEPVYELISENDSINQELIFFITQIEKDKNCLDKLHQKIDTISIKINNIQDILPEMRASEIRKKNISETINTQIKNELTNSFSEIDKLNEKQAKRDIFQTKFLLKNKIYLQKLQIISSLLKNNEFEKNSNTKDANLKNILGQNYALFNFKPTKPTEIDTFTVVAVGDIMLGSNIPDGWIPPNNDCTPFFDSLKTVLSDAKLTFGNFEGVFADTKEGAKKCNDPHWCYTFGMPTKYVNCFTSAGFDLLNIANNHSLDFGYNGLKRTMDIFDANNLNYAGTTSKPIDTFSINGTKIGFCAFAPGGANCQITDLKAMQKTVEHLDTICDIVIVSFHGGAEGAEHQHITREDEFYLEQNRGNVYKFSHAAIDAGADILLGHGPHVTRAIELYKDRFICYSMGNFATYHFISYGPFGMAPIFKVFTTKEGKFMKAKIISVNPSQLGPRLDVKNNALKKIQQLTREDFPENELLIGNDGWVFPKVANTEK